jgi:3-mercaptopyruvate sulfurtransferase SseA
MQASLTAIVLESLLGLENVRLYEGSMSEVDIDNFTKYKIGLIYFA